MQNRLLHSRKRYVAYKVNTSETIMRQEHVWNEERRQAHNHNKSQFGDARQFQRIGPLSRSVLTLAWLLSVRPSLNQLISGIGHTSCLFTE